MNQAVGSSTWGEQHDRALPACGAMRWLRGVAVGLTASTLAWLGHWFGAGVQPGLEPLIWVSGCAVLVSVALSGRRWGLPSLLSVLLGAQGVMHLCFADMPAAHGAHGGGHDDMGAAMSHASMSGAGMFHSGAPMVVSHVVAALLTALLLRRGEDWCWSLVELLTRPLTPPAAIEVPPTAPPRRVPLPLLIDATRLLLLADAQSRRGPPCLAR